MASAITDFLARVNQAAQDVNAAANAVSQKVSQGGDFAVRASNATTGAAVGAKTGSTVPTDIPPAVKYAGLGLLAYLLLKRL